MTAAPPHPRDTFEWLGEASETAFADAMARGRLHHAWLFTGPAGVGKASFAYRVARRLLGAAADPGRGPLGSLPGDPVSRQVSAQAHPDLLVLRRDDEQGKPRRAIPAEEARTLGEFFAKSPASAPWRVAIVDAADDLNNTAANAVLKTLEEPPPRGILLMVSHAPGRLLATIRSRCRRLRFEVPAREIAMEWLGRASGLGSRDSAALLDMAAGAPGEAWRLAARDAVELDADAAATIADPGRPISDHSATLAERFRAAAGADSFRFFFSRLCVHSRERARDLAASRSGEGDAAERWAEAAGMLGELVERVEAVNLDRGDALHLALGRLRALG